MKLFRDWRLPLVICFVLTAVAFFVPPPYGLLFVPPILVIGLHAFVAQRMDRAGMGFWRSEQVALIGRKLGLVFSSEDCFSLTERYGCFFDALSHRDGWHAPTGLEVSFPDKGNLLDMVKGFAENYSAVHRFRNVLHGVHRGREIYAFDYGDFSGAVIPCDYGFKTLVVRPEGIIDKTAAVFGLPSVKFESHEFSRLFHVASEDPKYAYSVINTRTMELLMTRPQWNVALTGNLAVLYHAPRWSANDYGEALEFLSDLVDLVPHFVRGELNSKDDPGASPRSRLLG